MLNRMSIKTANIDQIHTSTNFSVLQRACACGQHHSGGECESCRRQRQETTGLLQRFPSPGGRGVRSQGPVPPIVHEVLRSPGRPLDSAARATMEPRFGRDFSQVQVHTDGQAAKSARAVNAMAYTVGRDIVFGEGQYRPDNLQGQKLLAHELAHTIQQNQATAYHRNLTASRNPVSERAAKLASQAVIDRSPPLPQLNSSIGIARQERDSGVLEGSTEYLNEQIACVIRLGGCPESRDAGLPSPGEITQYNEDCRKETDYKGPDIEPNDIACHQFSSGVIIDEQRINELHRLMKEYRQRLDRNEISAEGIEQVNHAIDRAEQAIRRYLPTQEGEPSSAERGSTIKNAFVGGFLVAPAGENIAFTAAGRTIAAAGGLAADDVTGIGVADDVVIPFVIIAAGALLLIGLFSAGSSIVVDPGAVEAVENAIRTIEEVLTRPRVVPEERVEPRLVPREIPQERTRRRRREDCQAYPLRYHRGGDSIHNTCADLHPDIINIHPGSDYFVKPPRMPGKSFDALSADGTVWEVKTQSGKTATDPRLRRRTVDRFIAEATFEKSVATACGYPYKFAIAHPLLYAEAQPRLTALGVPVINTWQCLLTVDEVQRFITDLTQ
jgi:hypothetical protein